MTLVRFQPRDLVPATPEQVWEAVATSEGNAAWLFPNEIDADGAGAPQGSAASVRDPSRARRLVQRARVRHRGARGRELPLAVRAQRDLPSRGLGAQYEAIQQHTHFYLHTLGEYLEHFDGRRVTYIGEAPGGIRGTTDLSHA